MTKIGGDEMNKVLGYRKMLGITQQEMAQKLNIGIVAYRNKERGLNQFKEKEMIDILKIYTNKIPNLTLNDIFLDRNSHE